MPESDEDLVRRLMAQTQQGFEALLALSQRQGAEMKQMRAEIVLLQQQLAVLDAQIVELHKKLAFGGIPVGGAG